MKDNPLRERPARPASAAQRKRPLVGRGPAQQMVLHGFPRSIPSSHRVTHRPSADTVPARHVITAREERFEAIRRRAGLVAAPLLFALLLVISMDGLKPEAHRLAAPVMVLWIYGERISC